MTWLLIALLAAISPYVRDSFIPNGRWPARAFLKELGL